MESRRGGEIIHHHRWGITPILQRRMQKHPKGKTMTNTKKGFTKGSIVHVFATKGCRDLKPGPSSSERAGGDYADIEPTEDLLVIEKRGSTKAVCQRSHEDHVGMHILVDLNHIDETRAYNGLKTGRVAKVTLTPAETVEKLKKAQAEAQAKLEAAMLELMQAQEEAQMETVASEDDSRDEARELFAQG